MPRIKRCIIGGYPYHIINRGNGKQEVFHKDQDFSVFIKFMKEAKRRYLVNIFAYCLMPNHFHLVLMPDLPHYLSEWMHWLTTIHSLHYHNYFQTCGHIWQGRFRSFIIQNDEHLLTVLRYVEGNPVRAALVPSALDWGWSSHRERIGIESESLLDNLPLELPDQWTQYIDEPFSEKELEKLRQSVNRQSPFGSIDWQKKICLEFGLESTLRPRGRPRKK